MTKPLYIAILLGCSLLSSIASADTLSSRFKQPADEAKPWCYWYWLNGDITREGITKDLETMAQVGITRAMIGNVTFDGGVENALKMPGPDWFDATRQAFKEANRVGVELTMFNGPGWSQSGGPWIQPEQSMRRVIWNEIESQGGVIQQSIRANGVPGGGSQDIAVLAFPKLSSVSITGERSEKRYVFQHTEAFTARSLSITGGVTGSLFAVRNGTRELVTKIDIKAGHPKTDFLADAAQTVSFADVTAQRFELDYVPVKGANKKNKKKKASPAARVVLSSA
ncbi:MAG: glycosyl hydrolase, partial [Coraliomargarita sp.]